MARSTQASVVAWPAKGLRRVIHALGVVIFTVLVAGIVTRMLAVSAVQGVAGVGQSRRTARATTDRALHRAILSLPTLVSLLIVTCTVVLWCISLRWVNVNAMNDLGLVSVLPVSSIIALAGLMLGFCLIVNAREAIHPIVLVAFLLALIFMLYATPALVEQAPRFDVTYWLAGHTEYVLRNGTVNPYLDAYFNWPGFFVLTALLTKITGASSVLVFAPWASFVYNLLYIAPMYLIFTSFTRDRRTIWLGLWFFYITDWIWQDYFDPQGLNFFFYLVIIAILLKNFQRAPHTLVGDDHPSRKRFFSRRVRDSLTAVSAEDVGAQRVAWRGVGRRLASAWATRDGFAGALRRVRRWAALSDVPEAPEQHRRRVALVIAIIAIFALSVVSHPITPFFIFLSVSALTIFGKITPRWLPLLFAAMIVTWDFTAAMPYLAGHLRSDFASFGNFQVVAKTNVTDRLVAGSADHQLVSHLRVLMTAAIWGLAALSFALRWLSNKRASGGVKGLLRSFSPQDVTLLLLLGAPVLLVIAQPYGGEMAMRYYFFTLPIISFLAADIFRMHIAFERWRPRVTRVWAPSRRASAKTLPLGASAASLACLLLLSGFLFARYGNERADYVTTNEANAVAYLYQVAPVHSLLLAGWSGTPWRYHDLELYTYSQLYTGHGQALAFEMHNVSAILDRASESQYPATYVIFSRSQVAQAEMYAGVPGSAFSVMEQALLATGKFSLVYSNPDADILAYSRPPVRTAPRIPGIQRGLTW